MAVDPTVRERSGRRPSTTRVAVVAVLGLLAGTGASMALGWGGYPLPPAVLAATKQVEVAVGWSFLAVGLIAWRRRPDAPSGILMILFGFAWLIRLVGAIANPVAGWVGGVVAAASLGLLVHLLVTFPKGRITTGLQRGVVLAGYLLAVPVAVVVVAVGNLHGNGPPPGMLPGIPTVTSGESADLIEKLWATSIVTLLLVAAAVVLIRWHQAPPAAHRAARPTVFGGTAIALTIAAERAGTLVPYSEVAANLLGWSARVVLLVWPLALLIDVLRSRLDRSSLTQLMLQFEDGTPMPERLQAVVAGALHDPTARLAYWLPDRDAFVDAAGEIVDVDRPGPDRAVTFLERNGTRLAALEHDRSLQGEQELVNGVIAGVGLAVENERLHQEVHSQLVEVRASRARIVEAVDLARQRVERDLHGGVQQRLQAIDAELSDLQATAPEAAEPVVAARLERLTGQLTEALEELRTLARGIYPVLLADAGLGPAVAAVVDRSAVPANLTDRLTGRLPAAVERTGYFVVLEALDNAGRHADASEVTVELAADADRLQISVVDDGRGGADTAGPGLRALADRVAALGGELVVQSPPGGGTRIDTSLPLRFG